MAISEKIRKPADPNAALLVPYQDTDRSLEEKVISALHANSRIACDEIEVHVRDRNVYLEGKVPTETERFMAQECVSSIFGIRTVANYLTFPRR